MYYCCSHGTSCGGQSSERERRVEILYLLIPLSVVLVFVIGAVFWWAVHSGQFDDLEGPAHRVLMDDDRPPE